MTKAVLFDLFAIAPGAGTRPRAVNDALLAHGYQRVGADEFPGVPTAAVLEALVASGRLRPEDVTSVLAVARRSTLQAFAAAPFDPDAFCLLAGLARRYRVGVVTNEAADDAFAALRALDLGEFVHTVTTPEDAVGLYAPDPAVFDLACRRVGFPADAVAAVVASEHMGLAAVAAGCGRVLYGHVTPMTPRELWRALGAPGVTCPEFLAALKDAPRPENLTRAERASLAAHALGCDRRSRRGRLTRGGWASCATSSGATRRTPNSARWSMADEFGPDDPAAGCAMALGVRAEVKALREWGQQHREVHK